RAVSRGRTAAPTARAGRAPAAAQRPAGAPGARPGRHAADPGTATRAGADPAAAASRAATARADGRPGADAQRTKVIGEWCVGNFYYPRTTHLFSLNKCVVLPCSASAASMTVSESVGCG